MYLYLSIYLSSRGGLSSTKYANHAAYTCYVLAVHDHR